MRKSKIHPIITANVSFGSSRRDFSDAVNALKYATCPRLELRDAEHVIRAGTARMQNGVVEAMVRYVLRNRLRLYITINDTVDDCDFTHLSPTSREW